MVQEGVDLNKHVKNSNSFLKGRFKMMLCFMESSQKEDRNFSDSGVIAFFLSLEVFNRGSMPILKNIFALPVLTLAVCFVQFRIAGDFPGHIFFSP